MTATKASGVAAPMTWLVFTLLLASVAAAAVETAKVITTPVFAQIPQLQASKDFPVLVRIEAPPAVQQLRRIPIDLALVLDVGAGTARLDAVKEAVKFVIRQIHDDDRLVVVGPSSNSPLITGFLTRDARRNAEKFVDELEPRGEFSSGAGAGLEQAIKILRELSATVSRRSRARFIILVTDTATTEASRLFSELPREDDDLPPVHTVGLGAAYDPRALLAIARESQGTYSFVDDENTDSITGAIAVCLSGLKDVVAVGTRVLIEAPVGNRVTIERIDSGGYKTSTVIRDEKTSGEVAVGVLYAGEVKSFIVHLSVPALTGTTASLDGSCDKQQLLTASFVGYYRTSDEEDAAATEFESSQAILYVQRPSPEAIDMAGGVLQRVPVAVVMNHVARFGVLEMVTTFVDKEIWQLSSITMEVATKLRIQWEQFVQARQFWSGLDLGVLDVEVKSMVTILQDAAGRGTSTTSLSSATAYMLSWLSSYHMQRPTAMGSPSNVAAAFVTLNMQLTLQQAMANAGRCPTCEDRCVQPLPPAVLVPSEHGDDTYHVHPVMFNAINQAMKHMYLGLVQANNLTPCDDAGGVEVRRAA